MTELVAKDNKIKFLFFINSWMDFRILPLDVAGSDSVYEFTKKWFFTAEPLTLSWPVNPPKNELTYIRCLNHGFSLKAIDSQGNLAAVCINADESMMKENEPITCENLNKLYKFFEMVETQCGHIDNYLSVLVVAVADSYRKRGLCTKLLDHSLSLAQEKNFNGISILCTNKHTASAARAAGWTCVFTKPYTDYLDPHTGNQLYSPPYPHTHISIYRKSL